MRLSRSHSGSLLFVVFSAAAVVALAGFPPQECNALLPCPLDMRCCALKDKTYGSCVPRTSFWAEAKEGGRVISEGKIEDYPCSKYEFLKHEIVAGEGPIKDLTPDDKRYRCDSIGEFTCTKAKIDANVERTHSFYLQVWKVLFKAAKVFHAKKADSAFKSQLEQIFNAYKQRSQAVEKKLLEVVEEAGDVLTHTMTLWKDAGLAQSFDKVEESLLQSMYLVHAVFKDHLIKKISETAPTVINSILPALSKVLRTEWKLAEADHVTAALKRNLVVDVELLAVQSCSEFFDTELKPAAAAGHADAPPLPACASTTVGCDGGGPRPVCPLFQPNAGVQPGNAGVFMSLPLLQMGKVTATAVLAHEIGHHFFRTQGTFPVNRVRVSPDMQLGTKHPELMAKLQKAVEDEIVTPMCERFAEGCSKDDVPRLVMEMGSDFISARVTRILYPQLSVDEMAAALGKIFCIESGVSGYPPGRFRINTYMEHFKDRFTGCASHAPPPTKKGGKPGKPGKKRLFF